MAHIVAEKMNLCPAMSSHATLRRLLPEPSTSYAVAVVVYAVVSAQTEKAIDTFVRREDAERFLEEVRADDAELGERLRLEPIELEA